ncbi:MAG: recombination mediator RecR [Candidatus Pacebacteria bacterium]|nr:recombination mediator RecR [Candidatus Paceibacterota bacterium]
MRANSQGTEIEQLLYWLCKMPGFGPRSAKRIALFLLQNRGTVLEPLIQAMENARAKVQNCQACFALSTAPICSICGDSRRDGSLICVVAESSDVWSLERGGSFKGRYHVLGGTLAALAGRGPDKLTIAALVKRIADSASGLQPVQEVILALSATVEGQSTAHYLVDCLRPSGLLVTRLAHGLPMGGELDYLDDGTLAAALSARKPLA